MQTYIQKYIDDNCHYLSFDQILKMNKHDNGPINNVINYLERHCYGIWLLDDDTDENYLLFYINNRNEISGITLKLKIHLEKRNELTFAFAKIVNDEYSDDTDLIDVFNTFQNQTRTLLEKLDYFTFDKELKGKRGIVIVKDKVGINYVPRLNKIEAFRSIFRDSDFNQNDLDDNNKVYLMFNPRNNFTKIGRSKNPKLRERTLQGDDPETEILAYWKAPIQTETMLHKKYDSKRKRGEWFNLSISDLIEINEIMTKNK